MPTLSKYMDADIANGTITRVLSLTRYLGHSYADVLMSDGRRMVYMDTDYVRMTGEVARERYTYKPLNSNVLWEGV